MHSMVEGGSSPAKRGRGTMRSMVEGAGARGSRQRPWRSLAA
jgi:hypothetical protein